MIGIQFKKAQTASEIEEIHRLNHRIFAEEIGQHAPRPDGRLVDKFHDRNEYFIASKGGTVVGMVSVHAGPEFSIASRLKDPTILCTMRAPLEVRLLAILPEFRDGAMVAGLLSQVDAYARAAGYSDLLISGIVEREGMYRKLGFRPMGSPVRCGEAAFSPMRLSLDAPPEEFRRRQRLYGSHWQRHHTISLLPGPVEIAEEIAIAFHRKPISHRSRAFVELFEETRDRLSGLMGGLSCAILTGAGTLANDTVAANLRAAFGDAPGLILVNGEFGERLTRQAARAGLQYRVLRVDWGQPWDFAAIESALANRPAWIWCVHLETSTGVLNDLPRLLDLAQRSGGAVAADCVSSLGVVDPHGSAAARCFMASGVSGKALGSYAGLAFVFVSVAAMERLEGKSLCPTFDVLEAVKGQGPVSTISSPLTFAAYEALRLWYSNPTARYRHYEELGRWTRARIREAGLVPLAAEPVSAPTITTFALPSGSFARACTQAGFVIAHESDYLRARRWGQIATMGNLDPIALEPLFSTLTHCDREHKVYRQF